MKLAKGKGKMRLRHVVTCEPNDFKEASKKVNGKNAWKKRAYIVTPAVLEKLSRSKSVTSIASRKSVATSSKSTKTPAVEVKVHEAAAKDTQSNYETSGSDFETEYPVIADDNLSEQRQTDINLESKV